MVNYKCEVCNYSADRKSSIDKHNKSTSHLNKSDDISTKVVQIGSQCNKSTTIPLKSTQIHSNPLKSIEKKNKQLKCNFCNKIFSRSDALKRHLNDHCKIKNEKEKENDEIYQKLLIDMEKKLDDLKKENQKLKELKDKEIELKNETIKELNKYIQNTKPSNTTYNISVKNYVQKNYANAPGLKKLDDYGFIKYDDKLLDTIGYQYRNKILDKYLGDFLIGFYKKEDPAEQAIWNSDVSRLTYVIKELLVNNKSCWNTDPKGIRTKNYIINPLLIFLKNIINEYSINFSNTISDKNIEDITQLLDNLHSLTLLVKDINNNLMSDSIVKYIAPYFSLDKLPELLEK